MSKRYAVWSKKHDINLFKNQRTFKYLNYAKRVLLNQSQFVNDETLYVKEIEVHHPLRDFFRDIEETISPNDSYESAVVAKLEAMADDHCILKKEPFNDLSKALVKLYEKEFKF